MKASMEAMSQNKKEVCLYGSQEMSPKSILLRQRSIYAKKTLHVSKVTRTKQTKPREAKMSRELRKPYAASSTSRE